ncbi:MAG: hypothetical protein PVH35_08775, partial [Syntrophobacterales bacterium]
PYHIGMIMLKGGGGVDMVMCECDMCCCCPVLLNGRAWGFYRQVPSMTRSCMAPSRSLPQV